MATFNAPSTTGGGDKLSVSELEGHVVLVYVKSFEPDVQTVHGPSDAVKVNVVDLDTGTHHLDVLWFPKVIVGSLRGQIGQFVLASVGKGDAQPGKSAPWILNDASTAPKAVAAAEAWLAANPGVLDNGPQLTAPATGVPASSLL